MLRVVCSWILVILAASPFTAPFSTCSISVLFEQAAHFQLTGQPAAVIAGTRDDDDASADALTVSPVLKKIDLSGGAVLPLSNAVPSLSLPGRLTLPASATELIVAPPGAHVRSAVLRL